MPRPTAVKSGERTVELLIPLKAADPDRLAAVLARAEELAKGRDPPADGAALAPLGAVAPIDWSAEGVRALLNGAAKAPRRRRRRRPIRNVRQRTNISEETLKLAMLRRVEPSTCGGKDGPAICKRRFKTHRGAAAHRRSGDFGGAASFEVVAKDASTRSADLPIPPFCANLAHELRITPQIALEKEPIMQNAPAQSDTPRCRVVRGCDSVIGKQGLAFAPGISAQSVGAKAIHLEILTIPPGARAKAHKHVSHETAIYMISGEATTYFGDRLEHSFVTRGGDFAYIGANVPHLPINTGREPAIAVVARTDPNEQESVELLPELDALIP